MKNIPQFVTTNEACAMLDCGRSHFYDVERLGFIRHAALDQWPTFELTRGYLRCLDSLVDKARMILARAACLMRVSTISTSRPGSASMVCVTCRNLANLTVLWRN